MCQILDSIHKYVPSIPKPTTVTLESGEVLEYTDKEMWETMFGGDQLTVARARGAIDIRCTHDLEEEKQHGLIPGQRTGTQE